MSFHPVPKIGLFLVRSRNFAKKKQDGKGFPECPFSVCDRHHCDTPPCQKIRLDVCIIDLSYLYHQYTQFTKCFWAFLRFSMYYCQ